MRKYQQSTVKYVPELNTINKYTTNIICKKCYVTERNELCTFYVYSGLEIK